MRRFATCWDGLRPTSRKALMAVDDGDAQRSFDHPLYSMVEKRLVVRAVFDRYHGKGPLGLIRSVLEGWRTRSHRYCRRLQRLGMVSAVRVLGECGAAISTDVRPVSTLPGETTLGQTDLRRRDRRQAEKDQRARRRTSSGTRPRGPRRRFFLPRGVGSYRDAPGTRGRNPI